MISMRIPRAGEANDVTAKFVVSAGLLTRLTANMKRLWNKLWTLDYDSQYPFSATREGYGAFTSLAGFAVAQSVALTAVAKDEDSTLVILIYLFSVLATIAWIWWMLRRLREEQIGTPPLSTVVRAYDRPSIQYGRCTLAWTFFVALIMFALWVKGLLPNQTPRVPFDRSGEEACSVMYIDSVKPRDYLQDLGGTPQEREPLGIWIKWFKEKEENQKKKRMVTTVFVKQKQDFKKRYMPFAAKIRCNDAKYRFGDRLCYVMKPDQNSIRPIFRQLAFRQATALGPILETFDIPYADPGESLLLVLEIAAKPVLDERKKPKKDEKGQPILYELPDKEEGLGIAIEWSR
jgi:hypothetical protein